MAISSTSPSGFGEDTFGHADFGVDVARARAIVSAQRHSRLVGRLRVVLPSLAVLAAAGIVAYIVFDPRMQLAQQIDVQSTNFSGTKIVMQNPRLSGYSLNAQNQPQAYEITAERAEQNMSQPKEVDLFGLRMRMGMREDGWAQLHSSSGHMNNNTQMLDLFGTIEVTTDLGDRANLTEAKVNFTTSEIVSTKPVDIKFVQADLTADSMHLFESGQRAVFTGRVRMVLKPQNPQSQGAATP